MVRKCLSMMNCYRVRKYVDFALAAGATVMFTDMDIVELENSTVRVCVNLTDTLGGLERDVLVELTTTPGTAST